MLCWSGLFDYLPLGCRQLVAWGGAAQVYAANCRVPLFPTTLQGPKVLTGLASASTLDGYNTGAISHCMPCPIGASLPASRWLIAGCMAVLERPAQKTLRMACALHTCGPSANRPSNMPSVPTPCLPIRPVCHRGGAR